MQGGVFMASYFGKSQCHTCGLQPATRWSPVGSAKLLPLSTPSSRSACCSLLMAGASRDKGMAWRLWHALSREPSLMMSKGGARFHGCAMSLSVRRGEVWNVCGYY